LGALEVGPIFDRPKWELEGKFPPLSSLPFLFGYVVAKKVTALNYCHLLLFGFVVMKKATTRLLFLVLLQQRRRQQLANIAFFLLFCCNEEGDNDLLTSHFSFFFSVAMKKAMVVVIIVFFFLVLLQQIRHSITAKKMTITSYCPLLCFGSIAVKKVMVAC
jgi:hypothetical protein